MDYRNFFIKAVTFYLIYRHICEGGQEYKERRNKC